jgi:DNA polymerase III subunit gamma/tau
MAWYNKYRPTKFEDVIGQDLVKSVLQNSIAQNKIKHGYLLSGPKGTGKTTLARIFANAVNQTENNPEAKLDIIELDAASNTGVDNIRQLIDSAQTPPFAGKYKVYIIDEVHMLSKSAMNALLKILEEPPTYLIFLLATTNPEKLLPTVLSRLTKLAISSHSEADIVERLTYISSQEKMQIDSDSLKLIAKRAGGGQRDAINLLETLHSYNLEKYTLSDATNLLGLLPIELLHNLCVSLLAKDQTSLKQDLQIIEKSGIDGEMFLGQLLEFLLESSFNGQSNFDNLIIPMAEILDLKLPINTVVASIALVQAKIRQLDPQTVSQKKKLIETQPEISIPKIKEEEKPVFDLHQQDFENVVEAEKPLEESLVTESSEEILAEEVVEPQTNLEILEKPVGEVELLEPNAGQEDPELKQELETQNFETFETQKTQTVSEPEVKAQQSSINLTNSQLQAITKQSDCPSILKMIAPDLEISSQESSTISISTSSPLFLPQIKADKYSKYIKSFLQEAAGNTELKLEFELRQNIPKPKGSTRVSNFKVDEPSPVFSTPIGQKPKPVISSADSESKTESKTTSTSTKLDKVEKYFYFVYQALPEQTVGDISKVPIWTQDLEMPIKSEADQTNHEDLEEMFDFE